jgi:hypothetical protein
LRVVDQVGHDSRARHIPDRTLLGTIRPIEETHCRLVYEGRLPAVVTDLSANAEFAALPAVRELGIRAHL